MAKPFECGTCNRCCFHLTVGLTLLDLHRMAEYLDVAPEEVFAKYVKPMPPAEGESFLVLQKGEGGRCFHLDEEGRCGIHPAKPWVCSTYRCDQDPGFERGEVGLQWGAAYNNPDGHAALLEVMHARTATQSYISRNGSAFNEVDYKIAIREIEALRAGTEDDRLKVAMDLDGETVAMVYNCNKCRTREQCCVRASVTLDDVRRGAAAMALPVESFWGEYIDAIPSPIAPDSLTYKQSAHGKCTFLDPVTHRCGIKDAQPRNCAFMPCPRLASEELFQRYYIGAGTARDQYRQQVATTVTRQYMMQYGTAFNAMAFGRFMDAFDQLIENEAYYCDFLAAIREHRYVEDENEKQDVVPPGHVVRASAS